MHADIAIIMLFYINWIAETSRGCAAEGERLNTLCLWRNDARSRLSVSLATIGEIVCASYVYEWQELNEHGKNDRWERAGRMLSDRPSERERGEMVVDVEISAIFLDPTF